jgi:uncharacterized protein YdiU (UPF0061 family)
MSAEEPTLGLRFDNTFVRELPADPDSSNRGRQVHKACYSRVEPTAVRSPKVIATSREMVELLELDPAVVQLDAFAQTFGGNRLLPAMQPFAACYGGHQFGNWAGQLGDGRALSLGEVVTSSQQRWELQLKGAGPTPYSRTADGRAVMRSSVREFLCSEAMHHLGVPTTRALCLVSTGDQVVRDMLYDGNARAEPGAIVCRVAPSFLRFGNFELFASRDDKTRLRQLADYVIRHHFPEIAHLPASEIYVEWFRRVGQLTAVMVTHWMRVGFVHGVMNTDNMSVLGLTIDYGPYGWLDGYDADWTPNTTDAHGRRYRFGHQPAVARWNLARFGEALLPLVEDPSALQAAFDDYATTLAREHRQMTSAKLGFDDAASERTTAPPPCSSSELFEDLTLILQLTETDMTLFFRRLATLPTTGAPESAAARIDHVADAYYDLDALGETTRHQIAGWLARYVERARHDGVSDEERCARMNRVNPKVVFRNYLAQQAIDQAEKGDGSAVLDLLEVLRSPYAEQPEAERYALKRPEWARHRAGCSMLSCSS